MTYTMYLGGCSGIEKPVDINGNGIFEGDELTWDYGDSKNIEPWMIKPIFSVKKNSKGGFFAEGIAKNLYLHDFRFKYTQKI